MVEPSIQTPQAPQVPASPASTPASISGVWPNLCPMAHSEDWPGVPNWGEVVPRILSRSGQPEHAGYPEHAWQPEGGFTAGFKTLKRAGVRTVISLVGEHDERSAVEALGLQYFWIPLPDHHPFYVSRAGGDLADHFLRLVTTPEFWPGHIHCHTGSGRTGLATAMVRWAIDGWAFKAIREEARRFRRPQIALKLGVIGWLDPLQKLWFDVWRKDSRHPAGYLRDAVGLPPLPPSPPDPRAAGVRASLFGGFDPDERHP